MSVQLVGQSSGKKTEHYDPPLNPVDRVDIRQLFAAIRFGDAEIYCARGDDLHLRSLPRFGFHFSTGQLLLQTAATSMFGGTLFGGTSSIWLNFEERLFRELSEKAIRRGPFVSVPDLKEAIHPGARHG